ncbi:Alpha,alpha-trehalose-phosphate synthase [UDP-forming] 1 [Platanthera guangdongensis]|uniref:Alpha,alpha-trehalose-phosphate synthase [UDP-forming] 1 n=1 Tax=Platanthera guangdongensis TaxID=2320717 RepID=A0ABR2N2E9_9ASPA
MLGNKYTSRSQNRIDRLLRERELKKLNKIFTIDDNNAADSSRNSSGGETEVLLEDEMGLGEAHEGGVVEASPISSRTLRDGFGASEGKPMKQRLLVVANRLPVSAFRHGEDSWSLEISAGGLVSALLGVKDVDAKWIGWAGVNVPDVVGQKALRKALAEKRCIPVFLDEEIVHQYYNGYCNNILWPLFHYLGLPQEDRLATTRSFQSQFDAYKRANQMFADVVNQHYEEGDVVWCHDYHLMYLPKCLKEYNSKMKVGWFLHTPFPSSEIHRTLPSRSELLRSVLAADLVGFLLG